MKVPRFLQPIFTPPPARNDLEAKREQILFNMLAGMVVLGMILLSARSVLSIREQRWVTLIIFAGIYLWVVIIAAARRWPYKLRANSLIGLIYMLGVVSLTNDGLYGHGRLYLLAFVVMGVILFGRQGGIWTIAIGAGTIGVFWGLLQSKIITVQLLNTFDVHNNPAFWLNALVSYFAIGSAISISIVTLVQSLEGSLGEQRKLASTLQIERDQLEQNVTQRTEALERRLNQIRTAADISQRLGGVLEAGQILQQAVNLLAERLRLYFVGIFLIEEATMRSAKATYAVLRAGSGEVGQRMLDDGYRLPINDASVVGQAIVHRRFQTAAGGRRTGDVEEGSTYLPLAQTELALPLIGGERALGAIAIQSALPNAFDQDDVTILQGIADSLAAALENARLFQQVQENLEEIRTLNRQYTLQAWGQGTPEQQGRSTYDNELVSAPGGQPATLNIPLMLRSQAIGSLTLESDQQTWAPEELAFIEAVTTQAVLALENARLLEETQQRAGHERIVAEIARSVRASTDVDTILRTSLTELSRALQATDGKIELLLDE